MNEAGIVWYESFALEILIKTTLVMTVALSMSLISRQLSAAWRHWIWNTGFLACLALPVLAVILPMLPIVIEPTVTNPVSGYANSHTVVSPDPELKLWSLVFWRVLLTLYVLGVSWKLAQLLVSGFHLSKLTAQAQSAPPALQKEMSELTVYLGVKRSVTLLVSPNVESPMTFGLTKPVLIVPASINQWDRDSQRAALAHELAHIRRWDWHTLLSARIVYAFHWFNPICGYGLRQLERECERSCDDAALGIGIRPSTYATQLVNLAKQQLNLQPASLAMIGRPPLADRVHAILNPSERRETMNSIRILILGGCAAAVLIPLAACQTVSGRDTKTTVVQSSSNDLDNGLMGSPTTVVADHSDGFVLPDNSVPQEPNPVIAPEASIAPIPTVEPEVAPTPAQTIRPARSEPVPKPTRVPEAVPAPEPVRTPEAAPEPPHADQELHNQHQLHEHLSVLRHEEAIEAQARSKQAKARQLSQQAQRMQAEERRLVLEAERNAASQTRDEKQRARQLHQEATRLMEEQRRLAVAEREAEEQMRIEQEHKRQLQKEAVHIYNGEREADVTTRE